ncbi:alpha/beta hydrolase family protein [Egicoccus halophilus]|uniref:Peptidase S9 prolyl oligopeptidase catalytic domain-containing protein n=1 Tax=Egicoccus halophilus TaxID=1670830 RepID=A0A8J3EWZ3_9ACTN|nr:alpha/beta fold hydrolase [Egicoccus halophilus]GGI04723.1 hypothetical protein GCM10011354_10520 [Egicoccus halophilus]
MGLAATLLLVGCDADGLPADDPTTDGDEPADDDPAADDPPAEGEGPEATPDGDEVDAYAIAQAAQDAPRLQGITDASDFVPDFDDRGLERWQDEVPAIEDVTVTSTLDGHEQPVLWLPPSGPDAPLLVGLHTWSTPYLQHLGIPYARFAEEQGWAMVHPNFRGANDRPEATGSDLAVQDVVDAVDFAVEEGGADPDRVYAIGFSGGGMMALLLAGRHPDRLAGAVGWAPNHDLVDWHAYTAEQFPDEPYADWLEASCGGDPSTDEAAADECRHRSPAAHLDAAREAGVPVYLAHGTDDDLVPPDHGARAFDQLAAPQDRLGEEVVASLRELTLPDELDGELEVDPLFGEQDPPPRFSRASGPVTLVLYDDDHDLTYHPGLHWILGLDRRLADG